MNGSRIGSVCSGYEGLGAAVHAVLGGDLAFVADIDPDASKLLAYRFSRMLNLGDIKAVDWASLGTVDVFCGGFPCQPFSAAGRRLGTADERHLWPYLAKAIGALRPPLVVLENVYGHLTLGFDVVLADLAALGYDAEWVVVTASAAGACHRRARLFVLAFPATPRAVQGLPVAVIKDGGWVEPCESLFGAVPFTGRIPASGSMAGGRVHESPAVPVTGMTAGLLPTPQEFDSHFGEIGISAEAAARQIRRTDGYQRSTTGSLTKDLLMLKTPTAQLAVNGGSQHPDKRRAGGHGPTLADQVEHELLPTPTARENGGRNARHWDTSRGDDLPEAVMYLPTPAARDGKGRDMPGRKGGKSLPETLLPTPTAADGDRTSAVYPRGDATLLGALLPTPNATDWKGSGATAGRSRDGRPRTPGDADLPEAVGALLPTPRATDGEKGGPNQRGSSGDLMLPSAVMQFLPTPSVADGTGGHKTRSGDRKGEPLLGGIEMLLPTPRVTCRAGMEPSPSTVAGKHGADLGPAVGALLQTPSAGNFNDGEDLASWEARRERNLAKGINGNGQGTPLPVAAQQIAGRTDWGPYEPAIRRWEAVTGRPAPEPTVPGKKGNRVLNPALPEWMMGLPAGWITDVPGLSRNAQLKLAGNGVVPQQGVLALRILLSRAGFSVSEAGEAA